MSSRKLMRMKWASKIKKITFGALHLVIIIIIIIIILQTKSLDYPRVILKSQVGN
jgi:hypothetical protein